MPATQSTACSPGSGQDSSPSFGPEFDVLGHDSDSDSDSGGSSDGDDPNRFPVPPNNHTPNSNSIQPPSASNNSHLQPLNRACSGSGPSVNAAPLLSRPTSVDVCVARGWVEIMVQGHSGEVGRAGGGPARGGAKGWVWEARAEARKVAGSSVLGKGGRIGGFPSGRRAAAQEMAGGLAGHARGAGLCPL